MLIFKLIMAGLSCGLLYHNYIITHHPSVQAKIAGYVVVIFTVISFLVDAHLISTDNFFGTESSKKQQPSQYENTQPSNDSNSNQTPEIVQQTYSEPSIVDNTVQNEPTIQESIPPTKIDDALPTSGEWHDHTTGLVWMRCSLGQTWEKGACVGVADKFTWSDAVNQQGVLSDGHYWELPTIEELRTLIVKGKNGYNAPVNSLFEPYPDFFGVYWSSSSVTGHEEYAWIAGFGGADGSSSGDGLVTKDKKVYVRLVR